MTVSEAVTKDTNYLIVGETPGCSKLSKALELGINIIPQNRLSKMLSECGVSDGQEE